MSERHLMSVQSELVRETIVATICERVTARLRDPLPQPVQTVLDSAEHPQLARAGYLARVVEAELFEPARQPVPGLAQELGATDAGRSPWPDGVAGVARRLAGREPAERPDPGNADAITWRAPGPGGHVRHYVALRLAGSGDGSLKRAVVFGFVVRCCEEISPP